MYEQMDEPRGNHVKDCLNWILMVSLSPIAFLLFLLITLYSLLRFLCKVALLSIIVTINTPFIVMYNVSLLVFVYNRARLAHYWKSSPADWSQSDPRVNVGIEVKLILSDFFKVVAGELLLLMSAGIITYYTAPRRVFYYSTTIGVVAVLHKWLNTDCPSKTALSCLCDGCGLNPTMFLFSFIGFFDIGCHPIAKCSFVAKKAFLFKVKDVPNQSIKEVSQDGQNPIWDTTLRFLDPEPLPSHIQVDIKGDKELDDKEVNDKELNAAVKWHPFKEVVISETEPVKFDKWSAFERGLFQLSPRIEFVQKENGKHILKSSMVLKLVVGVKSVNLCNYPVERLELPENYSKANELFHFLHTLALEDGFVTDKMRGRHEHSLTLLQIVERVEESVGYEIVEPKDVKFVVAGCTDLQQ